jgi:hypothetical protein
MNAKRELTETELNHVAAGTLSLNYGIIEITGS